MDALRHDNVTYQGEPTTVPNLAENLNKNIPGANRAQQRQAPIAGERNEMQMAASIVANQFNGRAGEETPKPSLSESHEGWATRLCKCETRRLPSNFCGTQDQATCLMILYIKNI